MAVAGLLVLGAVSTARQQDLPPLFSEVIDVRVVNVEVVVTDRNGRRVSGLMPSDFELRVDGEPVPIDFFTVIEEGRALATAEDQTVAGVPFLDPDAPVGTNFLLFIDDFFSIKRDRDRVLDRLEEDFAGLGAQDELAAVAFDGKKVEMLTTWTNSPAELSGALREARRRTAHGLMRLGEMQANDRERRERERLQREPEAIPRSSLDHAELHYATNLEDQLERSVLAAVTTLRSFANRPGRKVMLLLAGGWPESPALYTIAGQGLAAADLAVAADSRLMSREEIYGPLISTANLLGYTLYPVDVPGFRSNFSLDASAGLDGNRASDPSAGEFQTRELLQNATLELLASSTGGLSMVNAQRDTALVDAIADTRSYYWLGFEPQRREDDEVHDVEVRIVDRPDLRARARESYVDMSRATELTMMMEGSLLFGNPPSAAPLGVRLGKSERRGPRRMTVPVEITIPLDEVQLLPVAGVWRNDLEVRITVMDEHGNRSETPVGNIRIAGQKAPQPGQFFTYETELKLRRRPHTFAVAVYDPLTGSILSASGQIAVR